MPPTSLFVKQRLWFISYSQASKIDACVLLFAQVLVELQRNCRGNEVMSVKYLVLQNIKRCIQSILQETDFFLDL